ncbi:unnamed protein product [Strongylus vulgaris]|uniref:UDP-glucuronosyltransferase n=1 Tax=Strongylus vulgaris TaxID=40348 RepID=A0A3P7I4H1_STRVU|nr:unnamed protein product [Strongylus vulgaris]
MPASWKMAFIEAFERFPNYHFIWRYVGIDLQDKLPTNVHIFKWLPQSDLLQNPKTKAFISHGGYNSLQEAISAGVPLITIPLFGDQPRNARLAERHHFAIRIHKNEVSVDTVADAISRVLTDESYSKNIKRLSRMVRKKPVSVSHLLVSWANFVAEFKALDNLVPAGNKLNFIQYYSLDVIAFLSIVAALILLITYAISKIAMMKTASSDGVCEPKDLIACQLFSFFSRFQVTSVFGTILYMPYIT